ncbi:hypothetical protein [Streptomyces sp. PTY087I2]|uniref:hypothetical protein n=1 Tax=Streptomyces sp. PTY087I2 TaxID=1819298 RepID=UPI00114CA983|nr:hypothetical protein [Streptomyces sp. PTY087I2]
MQKQFVTPDPQDLVNALGVEPEITGETQMTLMFFDVTGEGLTFSYNTVGRSVSVHWSTKSGDPKLKIFREGATLLRIQESDGSTTLFVEFATQDTTGVLELQIFPNVSATETSLLS